MMGGGLLPSLATRVGSHAQSLCLPPQTLLSHVVMFRRELKGHVAGGNGADEAPVFPDAPLTTMECTAPIRAQANMV